MAQDKSLPAEGRSNQEIPENCENLTDFMAHLQGLLVEDANIGEFLGDLASMTAQRLGADTGDVACGVTVVRQKRPVAAADSDALARRLDQIQNELGDGPCLTALRTGNMTYVPDVLAESRWPEYMQAVAATNIGSILALPLELSSTAEAVVNLYSTRAHGFSQKRIVAAERVTCTGAKTLHLALKLAHLQEARSNLSAALESRTIIDTAIGIIMAQNRCNRAVAFRILSGASSHRNVKLRTVAEEVVAKVAGDVGVRAYFDE